jgi:long-chain fatty acid transport protein
VDGNFTSPIQLNALVGPGESPIKANLNLPDSVTVGFSQQINDQWQLHLGGEWTNWSRFRRIPVVLDQFNVPLTSLNFEYDDSWFFSGGLEYAYSPEWTFRAGLAYELSAVNDRVRNVRISDNDRLWTSIGASYKWSEKVKFDIGYSHLFVKDAPVNIAPGHPEYNPARPVLFIGEAEPSVDIVSVALTYRWDAPAPQRQAPLIAKY